MAGKEEEEKAKPVDKGKEKAVDGEEPKKDGEKKEEGKDAKENGVMPPGRRRTSNGLY
jgi:hypothetical protein